MNRASRPPRSCPVAAASSQPASTSVGAPMPARCVPARAASRRAWPGRSRKMAVTAEESTMIGARRGGLRGCRGGESVAGAAGRRGSARSKTATGRAGADHRPDLALEERAQFLGTVLVNDLKREALSALLERAADRLGLRLAGQLGDFRSQALD